MVVELSLIFAHLPNPPPITIARPRQHIDRDDHKDDCSEPRAEEGGADHKCTNRCSQLVATDRKRKMSADAERRDAMPNDVKAYVSAVVAIVAIILVYWGGSPIRPEFSNLVLGIAVFMIISMWIFPEAGEKNECRKMIRIWP